MRTLESRFVNIISSDLRVTANPKDFSLIGLAPFINAFVRHHRIRINSANRRDVLIKFLHFYIAYYLMHDSGFVHYCVHNNKFISCPSFTYVHLQKIICEVRSHNKLVGFTSGKIEPISNLSIILHYLKDLDCEAFNQFLLLTEFQFFFKTEAELEKFMKDFQDYVEKVNKTNNEYDFIIEGLMIPQGIVFYPDRFDLFRGVLSFGVSTQLGIYRFRNTDVPLHFSTNQGTLAGLSMMSMELLVLFLRLYEPTITVNDLTSLQFGTGDIRIDVSNSPLEEAWFAYFNVTTGNNAGPAKTKGKGGHTKVGGFSTAQPAAEQDSGGDSEEVDTESTASVCGYGIDGRLVYIPIQKVVESKDLLVLYSLKDVVNFHNNVSTRKGFG